MSDTREILPCIHCGVPPDLHGTCCGWSNASHPCSTGGVITDKRHPGFGQPLTLWIHTFYDFSSNADACDISHAAGYGHGWKDGIEYAEQVVKIKTEELQKEVADAKAGENALALQINEMLFDADALRSLNDSLKQENEKMGREIRDLLECQGVQKVTYERITEENEQLKAENVLLKAKAKKWDKLAGKMAEFYKANSGADLLTIGEEVATVFGYL